MEGEISYEELREAIDLYYRGDLTKYTIWDFTAAEIGKLNNVDIKKLGTQVSVSGKARRGCIDLIVVSGLLKYGLARVYTGYAATIQKDPEALKSIVFKSMDEAMCWIKEYEHP